MNKKELIEAVNKESHDWVNRKSVTSLIEQLDEPEKVTIPQFVAEHIKHAKEIGKDLQDAMNSSSIHKEVDEWLYTDNNMELFARAWLDGYEEVEEEKRYYIRLKNVDKNYNYLNRINHLDAWCLTEIKTDKKFRTTHTRKQLEEAGFGEVFNSPLFEVEEVGE